MSLETSYKKNTDVSTLFLKVKNDNSREGHEWQSRGQRFDPAYLHHEKRHPIGCLFFILKIFGFRQGVAAFVFPFLLHSPVYRTGALIV